MWINSPFNTIQFQNKKTLLLTKAIAVLMVSLIVLVSCEDEKIIPKKGYIPNTPKQTDNLMAAYFWIPQNNINDSYWKDADYVKISLENRETKNLYPEGFLNMTGTYNGLDDFNSGKEINLTLKAGYNDDNIYILAEWNDETTNATYSTWKWDGPSDPIKNTSSETWSRQQNSDMLFIAFDLSESIKDVWQWNLALSAPLQSALNMSMDVNGEITHDDIPNYSDNSNGELNNGPKYEWNGERQEIENESGIVVLDPSYYLLDENKITFAGDIMQGQDIFNETADCRFCHGPNGNGVPDDYTDGGNLQRASLNKYTRDGLIEFIGSSAHEGGGGQYFGKIKNNQEMITNLITFIRGISGVPGTIINAPNNDIDITALSNISIGGIKKTNTRYQVLFIRALSTLKTNDISFLPNNKYSFSIGVSDNDNKNFVGASHLLLEFKSSKL